MDKNPYEKDVVEVDLKELFFYLLKHWYIIFACAVLFAGLLGGYDYLKQKKAVSAYQSQLVEVESGDLQTQLISDLRKDGYDVGIGADGEPETETETEIDYEKIRQDFEDDSAYYDRDVENIDRGLDELQDKISKQKEYMDESIYMHLDPYKLPVAEATVEITLTFDDYKDNVGSLATYFQNSLENGPYLKNLAKQMDTKVSYLRELFTISYATPTIYEDNSIVVSGDGSIDSESGDSSSSKGSYAINDLKGRLSFYVMGTDQQMAQTILDSMLDELRTLSAKKVSEIPHSLNILTRTDTIVVDTNVRNRQYDYDNWVMSLYNQLDAYKNRKNALKKPDIQSYLPQAETEVTDAAQTADSGALQPVYFSRRSLLKYAIIGFVIGAFLACLLLAAYHICSDVLYSYELLASRFPLRKLGEFKGHNAAVRSAETGVADMIAVNVKNFAAAAGAGGQKVRVLLTGASSEGTFAEIADGLKKRLPEFDFVLAPRVNDDPQSRALLPEASFTVLIEERGSSRYSEIRSEIETIVNVGKEIAGVAVA